MTYRIFCFITLEEMNFHRVKWKAGVSLRLFCARHNVRFILAVVELCCCAQFLILLPLSELLQLRQAAWKLVAIQSAFDLKTLRCGSFSTPPGHHIQVFQPCSTHPDITTLHSTWLMSSVSSTASITLYHSVFGVNVMRFAR